MPAANPRALEKAKSIPCDAIIFDLEDAVGADAKLEARAAAAEAVRSGDYGRRLLTIRCNGMATDWGHDDLAVAAQARPAAVVIPKVETLATLDDVAACLDEAGASDTSIWPMIETPTAILDARVLASHPRVGVLIVGTNDLARELRVPLGVAGRWNLGPHLAAAVLAARAAGRPIIDGVFNDITDAEGFAAEARQGVEMGFDGKTLIHPSQVEPANTTWTPSADEIDQARRVIDAFAAAEADGRGVATVDGRMVEALHVENARHTISIATAIAALHPSV
jgi:citrate lyase subunit beta/citryl-CoA lyase